MVPRGWSRTRAVAGQAAAVLTAAGVAMAVTACSPDTGWVQPNDSAAWPGMGGDARNSSYADRNAAPTLVPAWTRPTGGTNLSPASISNRGYVDFTSDTDAGCGTFSLELTVGRKIYCRRDAAGVDMETPLVDQFDSTYIGVPGWVLSPDSANEIRWRRPTAGDPLWLKFAGNGRILVITHIGQVMVLDAHSGDPMGPSWGLVPNLTVSDPADGIADCPLAGPGCPVAAPPAVDAGAQRAYVVVKPPGSAHGDLVAFGYAPVNGLDTIAPLWQRTDLADDPWGSPVLSADGKTLYVNGRDKKLIAVDAATGRTKWTYDTGYQTKLAPSVAPDGTIVLAASGMSRAPLIAIRDEGDSARELFRRIDVANVSVPAQVRGGLGYTVVRAWGGGHTQLIEFETDTGRTTRSFDLPDQVTSTSGVSIGPGGELVTISNFGEAYAFTSGKRTGDSERSD